MKKTFLFFIALIFLFGCSQSKKNEIKIGVILPLTGNLSFMGSPERNGFELALNNFIFKNESPVVDLIFEDNQSSSSNAVSAAHKLIQVDNIKAIIVANTGPNLAVAPLTEKDKLLHIAFCMEPDIQKQHELIFRLYESSIQEGEAILDYILDNKEKYKKIAFLYIDQPNFVKTVEDVIKPKLIEESNVELFFEKYKLDEVSFTPLLTKLKSRNVDGLVILGYGSEYPKLFNQLTELGIRNKVDIIGGWGFLYPQMDKKLLDGVKVAAPIFAISENEISNKFRNDYYEEYNAFPNFDAAFAYSALSILLEAIKKSESLSTEVIALNIEGQEFQTPIGNVLINNRELVVKMGIGVYNDGALIMHYN